MFQKLIQTKKQEHQIEHPIYILEILPDFLAVNISLPILTDTRTFRKSSNRQSSDCASGIAQSGREEYPPRSYITSFPFTKCCRSIGEYIWHWWSCADEKGGNSDLASFDEASSMWIVDKGNYLFKVGASSHDIKDTAALSLTGMKQKVGNSLKPQIKLDLLKK